MKTFFRFALLPVALLVVSGRTIRDYPSKKEDPRCYLWSTEMRCSEPPRHYWRFNGEGCVLVWDDDMCNTQNVHASNAECEKICVDRTR
ncbi:unnamed protein product [Ixodes pacificus]